MMHAWRRTDRGYFAGGRLFRLPACLPPTPRCGKGGGGGDGCGYMIRSIALGSSGRKARWNGRKSAVSAAAAISHVDVSGGGGVDSGETTSPRGRSIARGKSEVKCDWRTALDDVSLSPTTQHPPIPQSLHSHK